ICRRVRERQIAHIESLTHQTSFPNGRPGGTANRHSTLSAEYDGLYAPRIDRRPRTVCPRSTGTKAGPNFHESTDHSTRGRRDSQLGIPDAGLPADEPVELAITGRIR